MKTLKLKKQFSLKKEKIASLNQEQLHNVRGGGTVTWVGCAPPITAGCWGEQG
jgi:natural product precursor